jgi:hypothetical protein
LPVYPLAAFIVLALGTMTVAAGHRAPVDMITVENGCLKCADAHRIAKKLGLPPDQIGIQIDLAELRISRCQMGLFGYYPNKHILNPDIQISPQADQAIDKAQTNGRISCAQCWELATFLAMSRPDLASACEKKQIRIKPCQLGAF